MKRIIEGKIDFDYDDVTVGGYSIPRELGDFDPLDYDKEEKRLIPRYVRVTIEHIEPCETRYVEDA